jgi:hypothetical protein
MFLLFRDIKYKIKHLKLERLDVFFIGQPLVKSSVADPDPNMDPTDPYVFGPP